MKTIFYNSLLTLLICFNVQVNAQQCSGTPTAGTVTDLHPNTPMGGIDTLELSGNSTDSGTLVYWVASGPGCMPVNWVVISGAIGTKLPIIVPSWPIVYRASVTCTNSGLYSYSNPIGFNFGICCNTTIWPGETNQDDTVNNNDIIPIVCRFSQTGPTRNNASISWSAQTCAPWIGTYGCINLMHVDCNGDGVINALDTAAISLNYDTLHVRQDEQPAVKMNGIPDLYFDLTGVVFTPGSTVTIPIRFGSSTLPVHKLAAIAATLRIGGVNLNAPPAISFDTSWIGGGTNNTLHFTKKITNSKVDWTFGRTDSHNTNGYGTLGSVSFTVPANATNGQQIYFQLEHVKAVDSNGASISPFNVLADTGTVSNTGIGLASLPVKVFSLYPNPATKDAYIKCFAEKTTDIDVLVIDIMGKTQSVTSYKNVSGAQVLPLPVGKLSAGTYWVKLIVDGAYYPQAFRIVHQ